MEFILIGGAVRDGIMGLPVHDMDFVVVDPLGFDHMVEDLKAEGFHVHATTPEKFTARCRVPDHMIERIGHKDADFVLARIDGPYSDGRRPDFVEVGTLHDDQARRDFTCNSLALLPDGTILDPFDGRTDIENRVLRFVGDPEQRIREDGLRVLRAFRFAATKGFTMTPETWAACTSSHAVEMLSGMHFNRVRDELHKMFLADSAASVKLLAAAPSVCDVVFAGDIWLDATVAKKK